MDTEDFKWMWIKKTALEVARQTDDLVLAFISEHKCKPSEAELVYQMTPTGYRLYIRKRENTK